MLFERPVKIGDLVTVSGSEGTIRRMRVRATEIVADDGSVAIIPNSSFISSTVVNKSAVESPAGIQLTVTVRGAGSASEAMELLDRRIASSSVDLVDARTEIRLLRFEAAEWVFDVVAYPTGGRVDPKVRSGLLVSLSDLQAGDLTLAAT